MIPDVHVSHIMMDQKFKSNQMQASFVLILGLNKIDVESIRSYFVIFMTL